MKNIDIDDKKFVTVENTKGLSSSETIFHYKRSGQVITGTYQGGAIIEGFVVGKQLNEDSIELLFQCLTNTGELKAGHSRGKIFMRENGKLGLKFDWAWLNGDLSGGKSEYIEV
ncbi:hypothetical protein [Roseivirga sp.]|uniref:hypothetical protein n=1 Tax=Roseivirga sp. TaxID=1964215 RepID=UPI003B52FE94